MLIPRPEYELSKLRKRSFIFLLFGGLKIGIKFMVILGRIQKFSKFKSSSKMVLESFKTITLNMQSKLRCFSLFKNVGTHTKIEKLVRLQYDAICGNYHILFRFINLS